MKIFLIQKYQYILSLSKDKIEGQSDKNISLTHCLKIRTALQRSATILSIINIARSDMMKLEPKNEGKC